MSFHLRQGSNPLLHPLISQSLLYFQMRAVVVVVAAAAVAAVALGVVWRGFAIKPCAAFCEPLLLLKIISGKKPGFKGLRDQKSCVCVCVQTLQSNEFYLQNKKNLPVRLEKCETEFNFIQNTFLYCDTVTADIFLRRLRQTLMTSSVFYH